MAAGEGRGGHHVVGPVVIVIGDGVVAEVGGGSAGSGAGAGVLQAAVDFVTVGVETLRFGWKMRFVSSIFIKAKSILPYSFCRQT